MKPKSSSPPKTAVQHALDASLALQPPAKGTPLNEMLQYLSQKSSLSDRWCRESEKERLQTSRPALITFEQYTQQEEDRLAKIRQEAEASRLQQQQAEQGRQLQLQRQAEEARIAKERAEEAARLAAEAFACRRCPEKYPSNTKLHEHVRTKHAKPAKPTSDEKPPPPPPPMIAVATPSTPPTSPPPAPSAMSTTATPPSSPPTPITSHATTPATPKKPISWAEIASRPMTPSKPSRIPRPTALPTPPATPPPSPHLAPILQPQKSTNSSTKRSSITRFNKPPYLTVQDLYTRFHGKPKPTSLTTIQIRLPPAPPSGMRTRQMRITQYFKPAAKSPGSVTELAPARKYADSRGPSKSPGIDDLASFSKALASHPTHHTCRRCKQHFTSGNMLHRHLGHCNRSIKRWPPANNLTTGRHPCTTFTSSLLAHAG